MSGLVAAVKVSESVRSNPIAELADVFEQLCGRSCKREIFSVRQGDVSVAALDYASSPAFVIRNGKSFTVLSGSPLVDERSASDLRELDGHFAGFQYDSEADLVRIVNDRFGMQSLFVSRADGWMLVSTSAVTLAAYQRSSVDVIGAAAYLLCGSQFGPRTHWQGITRVEPATEIVVKNSDFRENQYWHPIACADPVRSIKDAVRSSARTWCDEMSSLAIRNPMQVDLTGGYDSRLVLAAMLASGREVTTQTAGGLDSIDVRIAQEVARVAGVEWRREGIDRNELDVDQLGLAVAWSSGTLDAFQLSDVFESHKKRLAGSVITGGGVEHFGPYPWLQEFARAGRTERVNVSNLFAMRLLSSPDDVPVSLELRREVELYLRSLVNQVCNRYQGCLNTVKLDAFYAYKSVGHFGAYRSATEVLTHSYIPGYFRSIFSEGFSASFELRARHRLHRGIIDFLNRSVASIETERGGPAAPVRASNFYRFAPYYYRLSKAAYSKVRGETQRKISDKLNLSDRYVIGRFQERGYLRDSALTYELLDAGFLSSSLCSRPHVLRRLYTVESALELGRPR